MAPIETSVMVRVGYGTLNRQKSLNATNDKMGLLLPARGSRSRPTTASGSLPWAPMANAHSAPGVTCAHRLRAAKEAAVTGLQASLPEALSRIYPGIQRYAESRDRTEAPTPGRRSVIWAGMQIKT